MIDVNVTHVAMMSRFFLEILASRPQKSGIINVSSQFGYFHGGAGASVYCATKAYVNYLTAGIAIEIDEKVDV